MDWFGICAPNKEGGGACCPGMCDPGRQVNDFSLRVMLLPLSGATEDLWGRCEGAQMAHRLSLICVCDYSKMRTYSCIT